MAALEIDQRDRNPVWDAWVSSAPGGHHLQTSGWAQVKALAGWRATRLLLRSGDEIAGGCQMLVRDLPLSRRIAYVPRGPLVPSGDPALLDQLLDGMREAAADQRVLLMKVQPPVDRQDMPAQLQDRGFVPSELHTAPGASVLVDLEGRDDAALLKGMRSTARRHVRTALKRGATVRVGDREDLGLLQELLEATAARQGFDPYPAAYYQRLWDAFGTTGQARLLIVEHEGTPMSAGLLIAFGDTVIYKIGAWGGGAVPGTNELMHYTAICWARESGFRYYDFEGIPVDVARTVLDGGPAPTNGVPFFKLGFGGDVVVFPGTHDVYFGRVLGAAVRRIAPRAERSRKVVHRIAGRAAA
jgi:lipid II:glycine glycyltransferase (peptidoglycan interpeptide bridge formation enzyme)